MGWFKEEKYGARTKYFLLTLAALVVFVSIMWLLLGQPKRVSYDREDTEFYGLPTAPRALVDLPQQVVIDDTSAYAENDALSLYQYTCAYYHEDKLTAEADYDREGRLINLNLWEYDTAGNIRTKQTENETDGVWTDDHIYEYDSSGRVVHEEIYRNEKLMENNYFRYTKIGRAGVSYSYLNEQVEGGISDYCASHTEFMEDESGRLQCVFRLNSLDLHVPGKVWKMQWAQRDDHMVNRVQYYQENAWSGRSDWYRNAPRADGEQFNLYEYDPVTEEMNLTLRLDYEWLITQGVFWQTPSFYRARYDGNLLLWEMSYSEEGLAYFSACGYDTDGRLHSALEYELQEGEPYAAFHRYEYPAKEEQQQYSYAIQGKEFRHTFADGAEVLFLFSDTGILSGIEMTDVSENTSEKYEFCESGEDIGKLEKMYIGADVITGERTILEKLEEEAQDYGFYGGEDLENRLER